MSDPPDAYEDGRRGEWRTYPRQLFAWINALPLPLAGLVYAALVVVGFPFAFALAWTAIIWIWPVLGIIAIWWTRHERAAQITHTVYLILSAAAGFALGYHAYANDFYGEYDAWTPVVGMVAFPVVLLIPYLLAWMLVCMALISEGSPDTSDGPSP